MNPPTQKRMGWTCVLYKVSSACSTYGTRRITLATNIYEIQMNVYIFVHIYFYFNFVSWYSVPTEHSWPISGCARFSSSAWQSLKITKGLSEDVIRRSTYNTMDRWKRTNNDLQNIAQKTTKDRATQTPLKSGCDFMFSGMVSSSASPLPIVYGLFFIDVVASASCFPITFYDVQLSLIELILYMWQLLCRQD